MNSPETKSPVAEKQVYSKQVKVLHSKRQSVMIPTQTSYELNEKNQTTNLDKYEPLTIVMKLTNNTNSNISTLTNPSKKSSLRIAPEMQKITFHKLQNYIKIQ